MVNFGRRGALTALLLIGALSTFSGTVRADMLIGLTVDNRLAIFDSANTNSVSLTAITGLGAGENLLGIDRRPANGVYYGLGSSSRLYSIDIVTGAATQVGSDGLFTINGTDFGFDFNPVPDRLRVVSNADQNLRLNPNNGTLGGTDTVLAYAAVDANVGQNPNIVGSAYTNNFNGATTTTLFGIDSNLNILVTQIPPNNGTLNTIGALGFDTTADVGFDIVTGSGVAFASLTGVGATNSQLFTIDLGTGAATLVGTINAGVVLRGLTAAVPEPSSIILAGLGGLCFIGLAWRRRRSG